MINTADIVVKNKYTPSYKNLNFMYNTKAKVHSSTMNMFDYYSDLKKKAFYMLDYFSGEIGKEEKMNIVFEDGHYATQEEINKRKKQYEKYIENSNIYKLIISFPEGYLEQNADIKKFEQNLAKDIIPTFLKKCGFKDINKMSYQFSLHTNTDNMHYHFSFAEKQPNYIGKHNKISYRFKGELSQEELKFFKNEILHYIKKEKVFTPLLIETNQEINKLKSYFNPKDQNYILNNKEDILLEDKIMRLGKSLDERRTNTNRIKFNSIKDKEIVKLTKEIKKEIFKSNNKELNKDYKSFLSNLSKINNYFDSLSSENHIQFKDYSLSKKKEEYLDNYVYNAIVNHAIYKYKYNGNKNLSENDLLQEIIYKQYKKSKTKNRFTILTNYLNKNKYEYKRQINQAIRNINQELEEAEKEFDKLFKSNEYEKTRF
ncbi:MAG: hypothetical protein IJ399_04080 [Bacilli bacterium]|nr:hypothetical protein [Bacilli bacterium]